MSEHIVQILENNKVTGVAIVTCNESSLCKDGTKNHIWNDVVMYTQSGKRLAWYSHREYAHLDSKQRERLVMKKQDDLMDQVNSSSVSCINCGIAYIEYDNPNFSEV